VRISSLILCGALVAGCARLSATPPVPLDYSNATPASQRPAPVHYLSLYSFTGRADGGSPQAALTAFNGGLYGTTSAYGSGYGTVFETNAFGTVRVLHRFQGYPDGAYPQAGVVALDGKLYGTTPLGGTHGGGTVFEVTTSGAERIVHNFGRSGDGAQPQADLLAHNGTLYGTTMNGGSHNKGTVFSVTPNGTEFVLHSFAGAPNDGGHPSAGLILVNGEFYGTSRSGGKSPSGGSVYKMSPFGQVRVLHSFGVASDDGSNPAGKLLYVRGAGLYGTTLHGGSLGLGTVFAMTTSGLETVLHSFGTGTDGAYPYGGLVELRGMLYGTTTGGGVSPKRSNECISSGASRAISYYRCGTIFKIRPFGGFESPVYRFTGYPDGANPEAALFVAGGVLYGTTYWGGSKVYYGTVFRVIP
jgi:uncharacterized repeat protein (TIGR03803 family)